MPEVRETGSARVLRQAEEHALELLWEVNQSGDMGVPNTEALHALLVMFARQVKHVRKKRGYA